MEREVKLVTNSIVSYQTGSQYGKYREIEVNRLTPLWP